MHLTGAFLSPPGAVTVNRMEPREAYDALVDGWLTRPDVSLGKSLRNETLTVHGKIFAFLKDDRLVVKLPAGVVSELIAEDRAVAFTSGGRTMREWAMLPLEPEGRTGWQSWMEQAHDYVAGSARP